MPIFAQGSAAVVLLAATLACTSPPDETEFNVGMTRSELIEQFGEPAAKQSIVKTSLHVFGPIETLWSSLPDQTQVEIWSYPVEGGSVELYFLNGADAASGRGFAPTGVVY